MTARARIAGLAAAIASLACAGVALAVVPSKGEYAGQTSQQVGVSLHVDKDHRVKRVTVHWFAPCDKGPSWGTKDTPDGTRDKDLPSDPIQQSGDGTFSDSGKYASRADEQGVQGHFTVKLHGHFTDRTHAQGTFDVKVRKTKKGKTVDHCHAAVTWSVG